MELIERKNENYAIVFNVNLIRATLNEAAEFKDYLAETIVSSEKDIIVNLSACEHLDSTFLGVLVSTYKRLKSQNRNLVIIEPVDQSSIFLTLNSIGKIFPLYTSVKVALEDIENKKLLEKEINELSNEQTVQVETSTDNSSKIESPEFEAASLQLIQEETKEEELNTETFKANEIQELPEIVEELQSESKAQDWKLIEHKNDEPELLVPSELNTEESILEENISELNSNEIEESPVIIKQSRKTEESHFGSSGVKWEFGFSS